MSFKVVFRSTILGEFSETFKYKLEGTKDLISLTFKGHVIAPTFRTCVPDSDEPLFELDFDTVSY